MSWGWWIRTAALLTSALLAAGSAPAQGAFAGRNGLLALDPPGGHGIELATAAGRVVGTVCPGAAIGELSQAGTPSCDRISDAMWSAGGQALAFVQRAGSRQLSIVYPDGSCLSCGEYLDPAVTGVVLTPSGRLLLTLFGADAASPGGGLFTAPLESTPPSFFLPPRGYARPKVRAVTGHPSQPALAGNGAEAFSSRLGRRARIFVVGARGRGAIRRVATGASPSWSPSGRQLAYTGGGWIRIESLRGDRSRRLIRGRDPVFAPDGRRIAFIGARGTVWIVSLDGRRARRLGGLRATHLDWQALPKVRPGCLIPAGSSVVASGPGIEILDDGAGVLGCVAAGARTRVLIIHRVRRQWLDHYQFAGSSVAYQVNADSSEFITCSPELISLAEVDLATGVTPLYDLAQNGCHPDGGSGSFELGSWVLAPSGAIAFVQSTAGPNPDGSTTTTDVLELHDSGGLRQIDAASTLSDIPPLGNLAVSGSTLTWTHDGQPRSAQVGGAP